MTSSRWATSCWRGGYLERRRTDDQAGPGYPAALIKVVIDRADGTGLRPDDLAVTVPPMSQVADPTSAHRPVRPVLPDPGREQDRDAVLSKLTDRERPVFTELAAGRSNREIATGLHLSEGTRKIPGRILTKLGRRSEVASLSVRTGHSAICLLLEFRGVPIAHNRRLGRGTADLGEIAAGELNGCGAKVLL